MSNIIAFASGRINGRHGFVIDFAPKTETLYTCDGCKVKFDPRDARWVGQQCLCPACHPESTEQEQ